MNIQLFKNLLESKLTAYHSFMERAAQFQEEKNKNRSKSKRWSDDKVERATLDMWDTVVKNIFEQVQSMDKCPSINVFNPLETWTRFMEKRELFEKLDDGLYEVEFE